MDNGPLESADPAVDSIAGSQGRSRSRGLRKQLVLPALALVAVAGLLFWLNSSQPPRTLHIWGHDYTSTGEVCMGDRCMEPPAAAPVTIEAARRFESQYSLPVLVVHGGFGPLSWFGLTDAGPKPSDSVWRVYLQVGPDAYVPYKWVTCCEPQW